MRREKWKVGRQQRVAFCILSSGILCWPLEWVAHLSYFAVEHRSEQGSINLILWHALSWVCKGALGVGTFHISFWNIPVGEGSSQLYFLQFSLKSTLAWAGGSTILYLWLKHLDPVRGYHRIRVLSCAPFGHSLMGRIWWWRNAVWYLSITIWPLSQACWSAARQVLRGTIALPGPASFPL